MTIVVKTVPPWNMRECAPLADWQWCGPDELVVTIAEGDPTEEFGMAIHEIVEAFLCKRRGIDEAAVDAFDLAFERERKVGKYDDDEEPGDHPDAPYRKEHRFAMLIESMIYHELQTQHTVEIHG